MEGIMKFILDVCIGISVSVIFSWCFWKITEIIQLLEKINKNLDSIRNEVYPIKRISENTENIRNKIDPIKKIADR